MTIKSLLIRFGLYFLGGMIVANIVANVFTLKLNTIDTILTMALLNYVVSKFLIDNNRELTKQEYWQIFFGHWHSAMFWAVDNWNRCTPVALTADEPITHFVSSFGPPDTLLLEPGHNLFAGFCCTNTIKYVRVD